MMRSHPSPLVLFGLALLVGINGLLLTAVVWRFVSGDQASGEIARWIPQLPRLDAAASPAAAAAADREILARPVFARSRAPFTPPLPPAPKPPPLAAVFVDPGFILGGIVIKGEIRKAYLLQKSKRDGAWVGEGDDFAGWTLQSVKPEGAKLQKESRIIELLLYAKP